MAKHLITLRLEPDLLARVDLRGGPGHRTKVIEDLLTALVERRVVIAPSPAPIEVNSGTEPEWPVLVCLKPT